LVVPVSVPFGGESNESERDRVLLPKRRIP
jgi:hypothetical protein